jgi:hypothetical protein
MPRGALMRISRDTGTGRAQRWVRPLAWGLATFSAVLVGAAVGAAVVTGLSLTDAVSSFLVTNAAMALSFPLCGLIWRPGVRPIRSAGCS